MAPEHAAPAKGDGTQTHARLGALVDMARERARLGMLRVAIAWPVDALSMDAARRIAAAGIAQPMLVGPRERLIQSADESGLRLADFECVDTADNAPEAARQAVSLARNGAAEVLMKGALHTDELMTAVVDRNTGLRGDRRISHAFVFDLPRYHKLLALADCVVNIAPNLKTKSDILANAVDLLRCLGVAVPKVGVVSAVETVNPAIQATLDAQALVGIARLGGFGQARVEGPFGFDNVFSAEAARIKRIQSDVAGDADLLLMPDLNAGNILYKSFNYVGGGDSAGLVLGARVPVVLTSRADSLQARIASVALAVLAGAKFDSA